MEKTSRIRKVEDGYNLVTTISCMFPAGDLNYIHGRKHNTLTNIKFGTYYLFWNFAFKVYKTASIMPSFGKRFIFMLFYQVVLG